MYFTFSKIGPITTKPYGKPGGFDHATVNFKAKWGWSEMSTLFEHAKESWPTLSAVIAALVALIVAIRYKIPDLTRRIIVIESKPSRDTDIDNSMNSIDDLRSRMEAVENKSASGVDLNRAIDGLQTICKFNQATCQKEAAIALAKRNKENDNKLGAIYEKLNQLSIQVAGLEKQIDFLVQDRQSASKLPN